MFNWSLQCCALWCLFWHHSEAAVSTKQCGKNRKSGITMISCQRAPAGAALAASGATHHVQAGSTDLQDTTDVSSWVSERPHRDTQQHAVTVIVICKFLSDERISANIPSALQRHLSGTLCRHLFWTVTLWHYLKLHLQLNCFLLILANCLDLSASISEAMAPWHCINCVLYYGIVLSCVKWYVFVAFGRLLNHDYVTFIGVLTSAQSNSHPDFKVRTSH